MISDFWLGVILTIAAEAIITILVDFNTSYVVIKPHLLFTILMKIIYFNTSYVVIKL